MYCEKCKKNFSVDSNFCDICGSKLIERKLENKKNQIVKNKKKKRSTGLIIALIIIGSCLVIGSTIFFGVSLFKYLGKIATLEYIELGTDKIPTMYTENENIQIDSYSKDVSLDEIEVEIEYYYDLFKYDAINMYKKLLEDNGFTYIDSEGDDWYFVKKSKDLGYVITVNIEEDYDYDGKYFTVTYEKEKNNISKYIKEITYKRIGEEKYGFIDINSNWQPYMSIDSSNMLQYSGKDGMLILYYIENPNFNAREYMNSIYSYVSSNGATELEVMEVTVAGYNAYQLTGYYDMENMYIAVWCFLDENNIMHYIEIEAKKYNSEIFSKIESYSILK